jgi:hypothetical protein
MSYLIPNGIGAGIHPFYSQPKPISKPAASTSAKPSMGIVLEKMLKEALSGEVQWNHQTALQGMDRVDTFKTQDKKGFALTLQGSRPNKVLSPESPAPESLRNWSLELSNPKTHYQKSLSGATVYLPILKETDSPNTQEQIIPKLFASAYKAKAKGPISGTAAPLIPVLEEMHQNLLDGKISASTTFLKPNPMFGIPTAVQLIQIGKKESRLEIAKMGEQLRFTLHHQGKTLKLNEEALENQGMSKVLTQLMEVAELAAK